MVGFRVGIFLLALVINPVFGLDIYTKSEMTVENGTNVRLSCTFKSNQIVGSHLTAFWTFRAGTGGQDFNVLHYSMGKPTIIHNRVTWDGNINKNDVSIIINNVNFKDNGTYTCNVFNDPDFSQFGAKIHVIVVEQGSLPKTGGIIAGAVIGAIAGLLLIIGIVFFIKRKEEDRRNAYIGSPVPHSH
ncbi:myelin protein zero-like 1 like isoform X2 [Scyliorhinus canicula]|uniref:myelin protein zero-like 1 like isoform X2 n=1 Tax=Scyliorhinus canicula TaxID=7830 RepID=UPI0018F701FC|nr:myelin protein zero-like 1 like isoform X2 [Scyliorhinus canicula]